MLCLLLITLPELFCIAPAQAQNQYNVPKVSALDFYQYSGSADQKVFAPAPTVHIVARFWNAVGTITGAKITVDGQQYAATVSGTTVSYDWDSSQAANPSEHTATVILTVKPDPYHDAVTYQSDQLQPPPPTGPYPSGVVYGDGRVADFVVGDIRLKSLQFTSNIALNQDQVTPVPTPEFTWDPGSRSLTTPQPACYVQGKNVGFTMTFCDPTGAALAGTATTGYGIKLQANPNANSNGQPAPSLTLYDNTTATPISATPFSGSTASVTASTALNSYVARYTTTFSALNIYAEFTHVTPTPTWGLVSSYASPNATIGNTLYAVVATPTAPMATPWVPVLDYACVWATGSTDATSATTALTNAEWNNCTYDGYTFYTDLSTDPAKNAITQDGQEVFSLQHFLNNALNKRNQLTGDCRVFADFLCCLSNAIGATPLQVQRSASANDINNNKNEHCFFTTKYGFQAPPVAGVAAQPETWAYHQWTTSNVYDGAFEVCTSNTPATYPASVIALTNKSLSDYKSALVDTTQSPCFWQPQTAFTPSVIN